MNAPRESATRPWVDAFADEMEAKLAENRHKGDRAGWAEMNPAWLLARLEDEVRELRAAIAYMPRCGCRSVSECYHFKRMAEPGVIRRECADVANFAMMIADVAGGMRPKPEDAK